MDEQSLYTLQSDTVLIVPTGSLTTHLNETLAAQKIQRNQLVWEAPNIVSWSEWLRDLWQHNRFAFDGIHSVIGPQQAKMLWTQVIEKSKQASSELTLLNVQQTARACMRSDRLLSDWACDKAALAADHVADVDQFLEWRQHYSAALKQRGLIDEPRLQSALIELLSKGALCFQVKKLVWYAYDLLTAAQQAFAAYCESVSNDSITGRAVAIEVLSGGPKRQTTNLNYLRYDTDKYELEHVLRQARALLEKQPKQRIHIVVPDLQHRYSQVQELARQTFYPNASLTDVQNNNCVYRLSLGRAMHESPTIEVALCLIGLLKSSLPMADLRFLFRSVFLGGVQRNKSEFYELERWLKHQRLRNVSLDRLETLFEEYKKSQELGELNENLSSESVDVLNQFIGKVTLFRDALTKKLSAQKQATGYAALRFSEWAQIFAEWLALWQWQTNPVGTELSSVAHQLRKRWDHVFQEFADLGTVQRSIGLSGAVSGFQQLARDTVFMPKSAASPVVISGLLDALGREIDVCFVTGMTDDFPAANKSDAFVPNYHLLPTGYPDASPQTSINQAQKVMQSLLTASAEAFVSFALARVDSGNEQRQASPIFSEQLINAKLISKPDLKSAEPPCVTADGIPQSNGSTLESYTDTRGPAWRKPDTARGGAAIFKNQSQCAFKAFVTHQLRFDVEQELEFGLDHFDRGNLTHQMLEILWQKIPDQAFLNGLDGNEQTTLLLASFDQLLQNNKDELNEEKLRLFKLEKTRVIELANEWLALERKRPSNFAVVETESKYRGEWAGITFDYIIDRVDVTDAGQSVIVDYKTGMVNKNDWQGERPREPQLPLYALVLDELKSNKVSGIAYGQVRRGDCKYVELAEVDIFPSSAKRGIDTQSLWQTSRRNWPEVFTRLANEFLVGEAAVNPVDKQACQYCELSAMCRIQELRERNTGCAADGGEVSDGR